MPDILSRSLSLCLQIRVLLQVLLLTPLPPLETALEEVPYETALTGIVADA